MKLLKSHKKRIFITISLMLVVALVALGAWAFFTNRQNATNTFTMGDGVEIVLSQPLWDLNHPVGIATDLYPGRVIQNDPTIESLLDDCWARIELVLQDASGNPIAGSNAAAIWSIIDDINPNFTLDTEFSDDLAGVRYYNYNYILSASDGPQVLFTSMTVPADWTPTKIKQIGDFKIIVSAQAVQSAGFENSPQEAFSALHQTAQ
ncbi:MAG: SipW-dependent-type signal peptide-containing protein [Oscillospiraceae bacterium]|nr:SipW-dependent-type signal peptide-containing protein [Oscillospiraceae bacterium]